MKFSGRKIGWAFGALGLGVAGFAFASHLPRSVDGVALGSAIGRIDFSAPANVSIAAGCSPDSFSGVAISPILGRLDFSPLAANYIGAPPAPSATVKNSILSSSFGRIYFDTNGGNVTINNVTTPPGPVSFGGKAVNFALGNISFIGVNTTWRPDCLGVPQVTLNVSPTTVVSGGNVNTPGLTWATANAVTCTASNDQANPQWTGGKALNNNTGWGINGLTVTTTFTLTCTNAAGTNSDSKTVTVTSGPSLSVSVSANPSSGPAPLNGVDFTMDVSGTATGPIQYRVDCTNDGSYEVNVTNSSDPYTAVDACSYGAQGTYTARVRVDRQGVNATQNVTITVSPPSSGGGGLFKVTHNPTATHPHTLNTKNAYPRDIGLQFSGALYTFANSPFTTFTVNCTDPSFTGPVTIEVDKDSSGAYKVLRDDLPNSSSQIGDGIGEGSTVALSGFKPRFEFTDGKLDSGPLSCGQTARFQIRLLRSSLSAGRYIVSMKATAGATVYKDDPAIPFASDEAEQNMNLVFIVGSTTPGFEEI